jgi:hypothetical protein
MQADGLLGALVLAGLMGMVGQGARTIVGLKKLHDVNASQPPGNQDAFLASRMFVSLMLGFIAGVLAALALGVKDLVGSTGFSGEMLLGLIAAGYAGTDFIEGFMEKVPLPGAGAGAVAGPGSTGSGVAVLPDQSGNGAAAKVAAQMEANLASQLNAQTSQLQADIASLKSTAAAGSPETSWALLTGPSAASLTPDLVARLFVPATPRANIRTHLPNVLAGLRSCDLIDRDMLLMALATIRAETEGFVPIDEFVSPYNTDQVAFDKYEPGTSTAVKLGNIEPGDGARFKGRGFIQLTGRDNYTRIGSQIGVDLVGNPTLANDSILAGRILAQFLANNEDPIRIALADGNLKVARRLVNGGSHGFDRFKDAYDKGLRLIPEGVEI